METFERLVLSEDSDIKVSAEVVATAQTYVSAMDIIQARGKRMMCDAPSGLLATQFFPGHVVNFRSNCFQNPSLF